MFQPVFEPITVLSRSHFTEREYKSLDDKLMQIDAVMAEKTNDGLFPALASVSRSSEGVCSVGSACADCCAALKLVYIDTARKRPNAVARNTGSEIATRVTVAGINVVTGSAF